MNHFYYFITVCLAIQLLFNDCCYCYVFLFMLMCNEKISVCAINCAHTVVCMQTNEINNI
jgi:hypothetical protein